MFLLNDEHIVAFIMMGKVDPLFFWAHTDEVKDCAYYFQNEYSSPHDRVLFLVLPNQINLLQQFNRGERGGQ